MPFLTLRRWLLSAVVVLFCSLPNPAWAVDEWYDVYLEARDELIPAERYAEALERLNEAIRLKSRSGLNEQSYGLQFIHYLPYLQMGLCHLRTGNFKDAIRMFDLEERQGAIGRDPALAAKLATLRQEAEAARQRQLARHLRDDVRRKEREARELWAAGKGAEARALLAEAEVAAEALGPNTQQRIEDLKQEWSAQESARLEAEERARQKRAALSEANRQLEAGQYGEAIRSFDDVLDIEPDNATAMAGKERAEEAIRASRSKQALESLGQQGIALAEDGRYDAAIPLLAEAATDPSNTAAREWLEKAQLRRQRIREQQALQRRIDALLGEAEQMLAERQYPQAQVRFESALELDPTNPRIQERLGFAERMTGDAVLSRWIPNRFPVLTIIEPRSLDFQIESDSATIIGVATDDRAIEKIDFFLGPELLGSQSPPQLDSEESLRNHRFEFLFALEPGLNEVTITVTDNLGLPRSQSFRITRRLRFWETDAFFPSALAGALTLVGFGFLVQYSRRRRALRRRFNPYIAGAPVLDDDMFFGREKLLNRILNVLHHNSLMITGERRIGKTTFLYHLRKVLTHDQGTDYRFFPVFTDLQGVTEDGFFHAVMGDILEDLRPEAETLSSLRFREDQESYDGRDFSHDLQRVINELKDRTSKRVRLALLIDEVDVLNEYSERINQRLRSIFMKTFSEHLVAIMSGVGIRRTWNSEGSPWYNFFDEVELSVFTREEAESLIRTPVAGVFRFDSEAVEAILEHSELKPYVIQKLCIHAINRMLEEGRTKVTLADVEAVREDVPHDDGPPPRTRPEASP